MIIIRKAEDISNYCQKQNESGNRIAFVPTMGALHNGHLGLIKNALQSHSVVVCSIFVNPSQFNNKDDFEQYPSTIEKDIEMLTLSGCHVLFLPSVPEVYPPSFKKKHYDIGYLETILEGYYRPGHFQGVCQVMDQLLTFIMPQNLYLGQKDFQQCMVIKKLIALIGMQNRINVHIISTMRENDGLAMSSRNLRLTSEQRKIAPVIFKELKSIKDQLQNKSPEQLKEMAISHLTESGFKVDYLEMVQKETLLPSSDKSTPLIVLVAAFLGPVRLIDNLPLN
jgi:pantoate--beta-alanine ligase